MMCAKHFFIWQRYLFISQIYGTTDIHEVHVPVYDIVCGR